MNDRKIALFALGAILVLIYLDIFVVVDSVFKALGIH